MVVIQRARPVHTSGIVRVCIDANWATYSDLHSKAYIEGVIKEFYNEKRVLDEIERTSKEWGGWFVALDDETVAGAAGGGMIDDEAAELYVIYLNPRRRNQGIGTKLLEAVTEQQKQLGAKKQWVSVTEGNQKAIPFYEAKGFQFQHKKTGYANAEGEDDNTVRYLRNI
ncbi:GNAT family N-acetyltransferase [Sediminibacillus albus]|uniref:Ribosomal protein S18 acetylase RimI n=1 Tax=Sediminibacillus albus TaxID=407036 RepID=A0A1G8WVQ7_9BACI|nr:GNAT family N-acetyltransferase [Sediminibacillus albus]SDJ81660.1 Ribosomal protein S18 acetylase RimI [Sediminibacillus albus]